MPRSIYNSLHQSPTSHNCGLPYPTIYLFLLLDCNLLDVSHAFLVDGAYIGNDLPVDATLKRLKLHLFWLS